MRTTATQRICAVILGWATVAAAIPFEAASFPVGVGFAGEDGVHEDEPLAGAPHGSSADREALGRIAYFTANGGQIGNPRILFSMEVPSMRAGFLASGVQYVLRDSGGGASVVVAFAGARSASPQPSGPLETRSSFLRGPDPSKWVTALPAYGSLTYHALYPGLDLSVRATPEGPEYEWHAAPGADLSAISMQYYGARSLSLTNAGGLSIEAGSANLQEEPLRAWTTDSTSVSCRYELRGPAEVGISCPSWDGGRPLTIDPLVFSTFLGGSSDDWFNAVAIGPNGTVYAAGYSRSTDFPTTVGAFDTSFNATYDIVISKLSANGSALLYSTFIGGNDSDNVYSLAVDQNGSAVVAAQTLGGALPVTAGAFQAACPGRGCAYVAKILPNGTGLEFATYLGGGGNAYAYAVALAADGSVVVAGSTDSLDFPTTPGAYNRSLNGNGSSPGVWDGFAAWLSSDGTTLLASTLLGGNASDSVQGLALDDNESVYIGLDTNSADMPTTPGARYRNAIGALDGFAAKLSRDLTTLLYGSYFGGTSNDFVEGIAVGATGAAALGGHTYSSDFPTTAGALDRTFQPTVDAYVIEFTPTAGALAFSTYLGGNGWDAVNDMALTANGTIALGGDTASTDFPIAGVANQTSLGGGGDDAFLALLASDGSSLYYSSYFGGNAFDLANGVAVDGAGDLVIAGYTRSSNFPRFRAFDSTIGADEAFVARILPRAALINISASAPAVRVTVDGSPFTAPLTVVCDTGSRRVDVPTPQLNGSTRWVFDGWGDGGSGARDVACSSDADLVALGHLEFLLNITTTAGIGNVTIDGHVFAVPLSAWLPSGWNAALEVPPAAESLGAAYTFSNWSDGGARNHTVVLVAPLNLSANYAITGYRASLSSSPLAFSIEVDGVLTAMPAALWWTPGSAHELFAPTLQAEGAGQRYRFTSWSSAAPSRHNLTADRPWNLTAFYGLEYRLNLSTTPMDFDFWVDDVPVPAPASLWYPNGSVVLVAANGSSIERADVRYRFDHWAGNAWPGSSRVLLMSGPLELDAVFAPAEFYVTFDCAIPGLNATLDNVSLSLPASRWFSNGSSHTLALASPQQVGAAFYVATGWSDGAPPTPSAYLVGRAEVRNALFDLAWQVTVGSDPPGIRLEVDDTPILDTQTFLWINGTMHSMSLTTPIALGPSTQRRFEAWNDGAPANRTYAVTGPAALVARYSTWYRVSASSPRGNTSCDASDCWYMTNSTATVRVEEIFNESPGVRQSFVGWQGDQASNSAIFNFTVRAPTALSAQWKTQFLLTVISPYANVSGGGWYDEGTDATFVVGPTTVETNGTRFLFDGWAGVPATTEATGHVTMTTPRTATALWREEPAKTPPPRSPGLEAAGAVAALATLALLSVASGRSRRR